MTYHKTRWRPFCLIALALMCAAQGAPGDETRPKMPDDQATADILNDISNATPTNSHRPPDSGSGRNLTLIELFAPSLITAAAIGIAGAVCGVFVILRREALLALAMPQVVAAGAAVGMRLGWSNTLPPALAAAAGAVIYLVITRRRRRQAQAESALPALYIGGLSISFLIIAGAGAHVEELQSLFTGIDVAVTPRKAWIAAPVLFTAAAMIVFAWRRWLLIAQASAAAELAGVNPAKWDALFLILLTTVLLLGTDSQGVVMVLALLFLPAGAALPWSPRLPVALWLAPVLALITVAVGFELSNRFTWPFSQSVGGVGFGLLLLSQLAARLR